MANSAMSRLAHALRARGIPATAADFGTFVTAAAPGRPDLVFFGKPRIHHVGIYLGPNRMLHAFRTGDVVKVSGFVREFVGVARPEPS